MHTILFTTMPHLNLQKYPDEQYQCSAIIIDVSPYLQSENEITKDMIKEAMCVLDITNKNSLEHILIRTNPNDTYYKEPVDMFPYPSPEACAYIIELGATVLGIDTPSIDHPHEKNIGGTNHGIFYDNKVALLENLFLSPRGSIEGATTTIFDPTREYPDARGIAEIYFFPLTHSQP